MSVKVVCVKLPRPLRSIFRLFSSKKNQKSP